MSLRWASSSSSRIKVACMPSSRSLCNRSSFGRLRNRVRVGSFGLKNLSHSQRSLCSSSSSSRTLVARICSSRSLLDCPTTRSLVKAPRLRLRPAGRRSKRLQYSSTTRSFQRLSRSQMTSSSEIQPCAVVFCLASWTDWLRSVGRSRELTMRTLGPERRSRRRKISHCSR